MQLPWRYRSRSSYAATLESARRQLDTRAHVLEGLILAVDRRAEVVEVIATSADAEGARSALVALLGIDDQQATAVLDLQLRQLAEVQRQRLADDLAQIRADIASWDPDLAATAPRFLRRGWMSLRER